uniref:Endoplasmic reticulum transmembrane protein n=1 Tax=Latimeria chalumnae TaxID=7897 RepID=H2ZU99_LATCH
VVAGRVVVFFFFYAAREVKKYSIGEKVDLQNNPGAVDHVHMKLFRAQRNLYIAGFALLLWFLLRRLVTLVSQHATLLASNEAFRKQAESATEAGKKYIDENDKLKKDLKAAGIEVTENDQKEPDIMEQNKKLKKEVAELNNELDSTKKALMKSENEILAIKKQAEGLTKEYDRLLEEHSQLQVSTGPRTPPPPLM